MPHSPLVTVIVPVYKAAAYLEKAVGSVLAQTCPDFELILVDDGSPDESGAIMDRFAAADPRVLAIHQRNQGVSAARNAGLDRASGLYVAFLDADDWYHPDFLKTLTQTAQTENCQLVSTAFVAVGIEHPPQVRSLAPAVVDRQTAMTLLMGYNSFNGYVWNKLFLRETIQKNSLRFQPDYPACEDALFVGSFLYHCTRIAVRDEVLYSYRQISGGANRGRYSGKAVYDPRWMSVFTMSEHFADLYDDPVIRRACFLHEVREAGIVLRSMTAANYHGPEFRQLQTLLRRGTPLFLQDKNSSRSQKLSVLLSFVSPRLELAVWRQRNQK